MDKTRSRDVSDPKLKACGLWEKTSGAGNRYWVGRLGGVRVLIFENRDRKGDNDPTHVLYFADGEKRGDPSARSSAPAPARSSAPVRRQHRSRKRAAADALYTPDPTLNDPLPPWLTGEENGTER
jgi:hypothetical protein